MIAWQNIALRRETTISDQASTGDVHISQNGENVFAHYDYWPYFLLHGILYCEQNNRSSPNLWGFGRVPLASERASEVPPLLRSIMTGATRRGLITIPKEGDDFKNDVLRVRSDTGVRIYPVINENDVLFYLTEDKRRVLAFDFSDMVNFFKGFVEPMQANVRGMRDLPRLIYANFPWDAYR